MIPCPSYTDIYIYIKEKEKGKRKRKPRGNFKRKKCGTKTKQISQIQVINQPNKKSSPKK
jgi:hypothetical protein